jgi:type II secretory pathway pseudopilin PulG
VSARFGFGLIELVVALTIVAVGVLALAAAALTAQRAFMSADALQRAGAAATMVLDSLMHQTDPAAGERLLDNCNLRWTARAAGRDLTVIDMTVELLDGGLPRTVTLQAMHTNATAR